jgi:hypothetical protein
MWYTDGWIRNGAVQLSFFERRFAPRMDPKKALKAMSLEIANCTSFRLINNGVGDIHFLRKRVLESAKLFGKEYREVEADLSFFVEAFADGPWPGEDFLVLSPGEKFAASTFFKYPETFQAGSRTGTPPSEGAFPRPRCGYGWGGAGRRGRLSRCQTSPKAMRRISARGRSGPGDGMMSDWSPRKDESVWRGTA